MLIKLGLFLALWYEVAIELGLGAKLAFVLTLLVIGAGLTLLRLPAQVMAVAGPRVAVVLLWVCLAWWAFPKVFSGYPAMSLLGGGLLMLGGAGLRYVATRYRREAAVLGPSGARSGVPLTCVVLGLIYAEVMSPMVMAAGLVVVGLPLRMGWQLIGAIPPERFDAKMGDGGAFRRKGMSDEL